MSPGTWELAAHHTEPGSCRQRRRRARRAERLPGMGPRRERCKHRDTTPGMGTCRQVCPTHLGNARTPEILVWWVPTPPPLLHLTKLSDSSPRNLCLYPRGAPPSPFPNRRTLLWAAGQHRSAPLTPLRTPNPLPRHLPCPRRARRDGARSGPRLPTAEPVRARAKTPKKSLSPRFTVQEEDPSHTFPPRSRRAGAGARRHLGSG